MAARIEGAPTIPDDSFIGVSNVRLGRVEDSKAITELVNTAFIKDTFFKKPDYYMRMKEDGKTALEVILDTKSDFLVYEEEDNNELLGCIKVDLDETYLHSSQRNHFSGIENVTKAIPSTENKYSEHKMNLHEPNDFKKNKNYSEVLENKNIYEASFGMLSVPERNGGRGIGSTLVNAMERYVVRNADAFNLKVINIKMPLISLRTDLFSFYEKRGYFFWKETCLCPDDTPMVLKQYEAEIKFLWYQKTIEK